MIKVYLFFIVVISLFFNGCATLVNTPNQELIFSSDPTGANVFIDGDSIGITPIAVKLKRSNNYTVKYKLDDYEPYETIMNKSSDGLVWGNLFSIIGIAIDAITDADYKFNSEVVKKELRYKSNKKLLQIDDNEKSYITYFIKTKKWKPFFSTYISTDLSGKFGSEFSENCYPVEDSYSMGVEASIKPCALYDIGLGINYQFSRKIKLEDNKKYNFNFISIYSPLKIYLMKNNKINPYLIANLGNNFCIENNTTEDENLIGFYYGGIGAGITLMNKINVEAMYKANTAIVPYWIPIAVAYTSFSLSMGYSFDTKENREYRNLFRPPNIHHCRKVKGKNNIIMPDKDIPENTIEKSYRKKDFDLEFNPLTSLYFAMLNEFYINSSFIFTDKIKNWDIVLPIRYRYSKSYKIHYELKKFLTLDIQFRKFLSKSKKRFYVSFGPRYLHIEGKYGNDPDDKKKDFLGITAGLGYRHFITKNLYYSHNLNITKPIFGDLDYLIQAYADEEINSDKFIFDYCIFNIGITF